MDLSKLVEWIKLSPKYLLPISLVSGFLLFSSEVLLEKFGLKEFVNNFRPWFGIVFLMATSLIVVDIFYQVSAWVKSRFVNTRNKKKRLERLRNLTLEEKDVFLGFLVPNTRTQFFPLNDGVVSGLEAEGFIFKSSNAGTWENWPFNIQPWAWTMMQLHSKEIFSEEDIKNYKNSNQTASDRAHTRARSW